MKIVIDQCSGVAPRIPPARLSPAGAQIARNVDVRRQTLQPLRSAGSLAVSLPENTKTIYKWGGTLSKRMWFAWAEDVDVCRGQIAGDDLEWTIFTGDGYPKITNANMYGLESPPEPDPYVPYEGYDPYVPSSESDLSGTDSFSEEYASYTIVPFGMDQRSTWLQVIIVPLEDAFALATGSVSITGGAIATTFSTDLSGLNSAINGTYSSLIEFESAVEAAAPSGYTVDFKSKDVGRVLSINHIYGGEVSELLTVASPFTITWGSP